MVLLNHLNRMVLLPSADQVVDLAEVLHLNLTVLQLLAHLNLMVLHLNLTVPQLHVRLNLMVPQLNDRHNLKVHQLRVHLNHMVLQPNDHLNLTVLQLNDHPNLMVLHLNRLEAQANLIVPQLNPSLLQVNLTEHQPRDHLKATVHLPLVHHRVTVHQLHVHLKVMEHQLNDHLNRMVHHLSHLNRTAPQVSRTAHQVNRTMHLASLMVRHQPAAAEVLEVDLAVDSVAHRLKATVLQLNSHHSNTVLHPPVVNSTLATVDTLIKLTKYVPVGLKS